MGKNNVLKVFLENMVRIIRQSKHVGQEKNLKHSRNSCLKLETTLGSRAREGCMLK